MAETSSSAKATTLSKRPIQELIISGQEVPKNFIYKGSDAGTLDDSKPLTEIPIIDIGLLTSPTSSREELDKLHSALSFWRCFQIINHGMEPAFLDQLRQVIKHFFALSPEKKNKYLKESGSIEGYGNDGVASEDEIRDWVDRLSLTVSPEHQISPKFWPENPQSFRETLNEYTKKVHVIVQVLLKATAVSLNLEENCFLDMYGEQPFTVARFNFYPPCPRPDLVLGQRPHSDGSTFTILLQDKEVEGLQYQKDNQWFRVPIIPEALVVNVGDQTEIMSNGIFKSLVHRVVANSEKERISLAMFCLPNSDRVIEPVNGLVTEARPRLYKTVKDYSSLFHELYPKEKRPIEAFII